MIALWFLALPDRLRGALRWWKRILLGAAAGWLVTSVAGAFLLVWLQLGAGVAEGTANIVGAAVVWSGTALGGFVSYVLRP